MEKTTYLQGIFSSSPDDIESTTQLLIMQSNGLPMNLMFPIVKENIFAVGNTKSPVVGLMLEVVLGSKVDALEIDALYDLFSNFNETDVIHRLRFLKLVPMFSNVLLERELLHGFDLRLVLNSWLISDPNFLVRSKCAEVLMGVCLGFSRELIESHPEIEGFVNDSWSALSSSIFNDSHNLPLITGLKCITRFFDNRKYDQLDSYHFQNVLRYIIPDINRVLSRLSLLEGSDIGEGLKTLKHLLILLITSPDLSFNISIDNVIEFYFIGNINIDPSVNFIIAKSILEFGKHMELRPSWIISVCRSMIEILKNTKYQYFSAPIMNFLEELFPLIVEDILFSTLIRETLNVLCNSSIPEQNKFNYFHLLSDIVLHVSQSTLSSEIIRLIISKLNVSGRADRMYDNNWNLQENYGFRPKSIEPRMLPPYKPRTNPNSYEKNYLIEVFVERFLSQAYLYFYNMIQRPLEHPVLCFAIDSLNHILLYNSKRLTDYWEDHPELQEKIRNQYLQILSLTCKITDLLNDEEMSTITIESINMLIETFEDITHENTKLHITITAAKFLNNSEFKKISQKIFHVVTFMFYSLINYDHDSNIENHQGYLKNTLHHYKAPPHFEAILECLILVYCRDQSLRDKINSFFENLDTIYEEEFMTRDLCRIYYNNMKESSFIKSNEYSLELTDTRGSSTFVHQFTNKTETREKEILSAFPLTAFAKYHSNPAKKKYCIEFKVQNNSEIILRNLKCKVSMSGSLDHHMINDSGYFTPKLLPNESISWSMSFSPKKFNVGAILLEIAIGASERSQSFFSEPFRVNSCDLIQPLSISQADLTREWRSQFRGVDLRVQIQHMVDGEILVRQLTKFFSLITGFEYHQDNSLQCGLAGVTWWGDPVYLFMRFKKTKGFPETQMEVRSSSSQLLDRIKRKPKPWLQDLLFFPIKIKEI